MRNYTFKKAIAPNGSIRYEMLTDWSMDKRDSDYIKKKVIRRYFARTRVTPIKTVHRIYNYPGFRVTFASGVIITVTEMEALK